jgi:hypothetical protein
MLSLTARTARLNQDYKGKSKEKDGEITKLLTFGLDEIEIDETEFGAITGEPHGARAIIDQTKDGPRPMFKCFKPWQLEEDVENAAVTVRLRGGTEFTFTACRLSKIRFKVNGAGVIEMSCKVLTAPALDAKHAEFIANSGELCDASLNGTQASDQAQLPLNRHGNGEAPEQGDKAKPRGRPRKNGSEATAH